MRAVSTNPRVLVRRRYTEVVSPGEIGRLLRHLDRTQMVTLRVPYPNAFWAGHKQVAGGVNFYSVGHAVVRSARFLAEDPAVAQRSVRCDVVHTNVSLLTVIHVEMFSIG
jgi:hypothetical protein